MEESKIRMCDFMDYIGSIIFGIFVRKEAEQLLRQDGDFLVRESQQPGPGPGQQNSRIENINNNNNILH